MKRLSIFLFILLIAGCAMPRSKGANFHYIEKPNPNTAKAIVYIYRVGQGNPMKIGSVKIYVDNQKIFHVRDKGFTWLFLEPGVHKFEAKWPWEQKPLFEEGHYETKFFSRNFEAGKTYYINYKIVKDNNPVTYTESTSLLGKAMSKTHVISVGLLEENEQEALKNLEGCGYQSNNFD